MQAKPNGFTLIEVMVASVILFSVISVVSVVYKGVVESTIKSSNHVSISGSIPFISRLIVEELRVANISPQETLSQKGRWSDVDFSWQATIDSISSALPLTDPESSKIIQPPAKFISWNVVLEISSGSSSQTFSYQELTWNES